MIYKLFEQISQDVWFRLRDTSRASIRQGEETITDIILLEILRSGNKNIIVVQTPKIKEPEKGTDWEWWIGNEKTGWLRYAVQAKKIDPKTLNYKSLNYKSGKKPNQKRQVDILKRYAEKNNAIPLYSFYNYVRVRNNDDLHSFWHQNKEEYQIEQFGWTCSPIENILKLLDSNVRGNKNFESIHCRKNTFPIRYLMHSKNVENLLNSCKEKGEDVVGYHKSLPPFFKNIQLLIDRDDEEEMRKKDKEYPLGIAYKTISEDSIFMSPNNYDNNIVIKNAPIISEEYYDKQLGLYPKRILKIDIGEK
ncbi:DUF6615 family protein [Poritiphilus flavus]|uniref:DUF6615 family protein n=1 Tax=Poritiphilus flavus TaxID=2697053 RepID=UPI001EEBFC4C|nr:DUF6615 family protein [Poritiphilus flavus]